MTQDKAREFFSSYYDGTIEKGFKQALEQKFRVDADLLAEYKEFEGVLNSLSFLQGEEIEVPFDLNDKISARIDKHVWDQKKAPAVSIFSGFKSYVFGAIAVVAIVGASVTLHQKGGKAAEAGIGISSGATVDKLEASVKDDVLHLNYTPSTPEQVIVRSEDGKVLRQVEVKDALDTTLVNSQPNATLMNVSVGQQVPTTYFAIPGSTREMKTSGTGSVLEFAKALSGYYKVPVEITGQPDGNISWTFSGSDVRQAAQTNLGSKFSVDQRADNLLSITNN